jgi:uncharacterized membrane protein YgcG
MSVLTSGWYYDPSWNFYTFVPTRSWFSSPYGFAFFNDYRECAGYNPYYYGGGYSSASYVATSGASVSPSPSTNGSPRTALRLHQRVSPSVVSGIDRSAVRIATDRRIRMSEPYGADGFNAERSTPTGHSSSSSSSSSPSSTSGHSGGGGGYSSGGGGSFNPPTNAPSHSSGPHGGGASQPKGHVQ